MSDADGLICAFLDRRLTDADAERFADLVRTDDAFVARVAEMSLLEYQLNDEQVSGVGAPPAADEVVDAPPALARLRWSRRLGIAAAVLLAAAVVAVYLMASGGDPDRRVPLSLATPIATLIESTGDVAIDGNRGHEGQEFPAGTYAVDSGSAQFLLNNRVTMHLVGQTKLLVSDPSFVHLDRGEAHFEVPHGVTGFTVQLPGEIKVVDLGTAFSVGIDESTGQATVRVWEGSVRLYRDAEDESGLTLTAGAEARIADGRVALGRLDRADDTETAAAVDRLSYRVGATLVGQGFDGGGFVGPWRGSRAFTVVAVDRDDPVAAVRDAADDVYLQRTLAAPIDFDRDGVHYLSFLLFDEDVDESEEYFWVGLQSSDAGDPVWDAKAAFGVSSSERAMVATLSTLTGYQAGPKIPIGRWCRYICRVTTREQGPDELALLVLDPGDPAPATDPVVWSMTRSGHITGTAEWLHIQAGPKTQTRFDDIRIGSSLDSVMPPLSNRPPRKENSE